MQSTSFKLLQRALESEKEEVDNEAPAGQDEKPEPQAPSPQPQMAPPPPMAPSSIPPIEPGMSTYLIFNCCTIQDYCLIPK